MSFLLPGTGFGGSCFPKDVKALVSYGSQIGQPLRILEAVIETNNMQPGLTVALVREAVGNLTGKCIAILGLAFKPGTDDIRESPAIPVIRALLKEGARVIAHDPIAIKSMKEELLNVDLVYCDNLKETIKNADAIVLITSWPEYRGIYDQIKSRPVPVIDGRRFLDKGKFMHYSGIGLGKPQMGVGAEGGQP